MENPFLKDYTIVDLETTGLSPAKNEIIEISALKIRDNKVVEKFTTLVKPDGEINSFISELTGITNDMVQTAPKINSVLPDFIDFVKNDCIIGHNIEFDLRFLRHNYNKYFTNSLDNKSLDTVKLARKFCPNLGSYKLENLAKQFNISTKGHHRALNDCEMTFQLYNAIRKNSTPTEQIKIMI